MNAFEKRAGDGSPQHAVFRGAEADILGANDDVYVLFLIEACIHAFKLASRKLA